MAVDLFNADYSRLTDSSLYAAIEEFTRQTLPQSDRTQEGYTVDFKERTRVWIGSLTGSHLGCHGTDFTIVAHGGKTRLGTGSVNTIYAGHFVVQTVSEHLHAPYVSDQASFITPPPTSCDERRVEIYPNGPKKAEWPQTPFTDDGESGVAILMDRWRTGERIDKISNAVPLKA